MKSICLTIWSNMSSCDNTCTKQHQHYFPSWFAYKHKQWHRVCSAKVMLLFKCHLFWYPIYMTIYHSKWVPLDMTHGDVFVVYIIYTDTAQLWLLLFILWWYWIFLSTYTRFTWLNLSQNIDYVITVMINIYSTPMYSNCWLIVSFSVALFSSNGVNILPT